MKRFIILLCLIPLGCSVESSTVQDTPVTTKNEPKVVKILDKNCPSEPLLEMYENFVELGIKGANLTTDQANVTFSKRKSPEIEITKNLTSDFGTAFLKDACSFEGLIFSIDDARNNYLGAYQITYNSEKSAALAANILENLDSVQLKFFKVATVFDWRLSENSILINYHSPAMTIYYEHNVSEFSK